MRQWEPGKGSTWPEHRAQRVAAVSGTRARRSLQRQHLMALGATALSYLTEIVHRRPHTWVRDVEQLHVAPSPRRRCPPRRVRPGAHGAGHRRRVHRARSRGRRARVALRRRPADDDSGTSPAARRLGPGRRRRPKGRSAAEHLAAAQHGGILSPRRRPVMIAPDHDLDSLFKRLHLATARRVWRDLVSHLRHRRGPPALPRRQRAPPPATLDDLHDQHAAEGVGPGPAR